MTADGAGSRTEESSRPLPQKLWICHKNTEEVDGKAYQRMVDALSLRGREKVNATKNELHRRQRILAYSLLEANGQEPEELYEPWETGNGGRHFSISHSGRLVWVAMADVPVGIDVEEISRTDASRVQKVGRSHFFTEGERRRLSAASVEEFLYVWTFKEAMAKLTGVPLARLLGETDYFDIQKQAEETDGFWRWTMEETVYAMRQWAEDGGIVTVCLKGTPQG